MRYQKSLLLTVVPLALIALGTHFYELIAPIYSGPSGYDQDPAYVYLLNGLSILAGNAPGHIDHPGTPLQLFVAAFIPIWALLTSPESFGLGLIHSVLNDPEHYIRGVCFALLVINALCLIYAGARIFSATGSIFLAVSFQLTPLIFSPVTPRTFYLSPEAFLFAFSMLTVGILAPQIFNPAQCTSANSRLAKLSGITLGVGIATKVTFLPLLGMLMVFRDWKKISWGLVSALVAFLLAISPIWTQVARLTRWMLDIIFNSELYGRGAPGIIDLSLVPSRLSELNQAFPLYFFVVSALTAILISLFLVRFAMRMSTRMGHVSVFDAKLVAFTSRVNPYLPGRISFVLLLVLCAQTLIVLKHFGQHYMVPALPVAVMAFVWMIRVAGVFLAGPVRGVAPALILAFLVAFSAGGLTNLHANLLADRIKRNQEAEKISHEISKHLDPIVVGAYRCTLPECALDFGFGYTPGFNVRFAPAHLNNFYSFNIWNMKLFSYTQSSFGWTELDVIKTWLAAGRTILLVSPEYEQLRVFDTLMLVEGGSGYWSAVNAYQVTGIRQ